MDRGRTTKSGESNKSSSLLSDQENQNVYNIIGRRCVTLSTTVVQAFKCRRGENRWIKFAVGVACFVKDNEKKSYYISLVNLMTQSMEWEQELYNHFKYNQSKNFFHSFEAHDCVVGLNFADLQEASHFNQVITEKLRVKEQRKQEKRQTQVRRDNTMVNRNNDRNTLQPRNVHSNQTLNPTHNSSVALEKKKPADKKGGKNKKGKLSKDDIGAPSDFRHVGHVGWDPKGGFDVNNIDPQWKTLFEKIGVTEKELADEETSKFIYDFVESHGGIEKATEKMEKSKGSSGQGAPPPPPPARNAPPPPPNRAGPPRDQAPPPPGQRGPPSRGAPRPPPHSRAAPPPPPPQQSRSAAPPPPQINAPPPPPPPPSAGAPPPPPPPPGTGAPPPPQSSGGPPPPPGPSRGGLLDQIHQGISLTKVTPHEYRESSGDARGDLLSEIRGGRALKSVSQSDIESQRGSVSEDQNLDGLAGALAKALEERKTHIQVSDDDDDDDFDDDDDEEWDD